MCLLQKLFAKRKCHAQNWIAEYGLQMIIKNRIVINLSQRRVYSHGRRVYSHAKSGKIQLCNYVMSTDHSNVAQR